MNKLLVYFIIVAMIFAVGSISAAMAYYIISNGSTEPSKDYEPAEETTTVTEVVSTTLNLPSCSDGVKNQDETGVDCGGICETCPQIACHTDSDCGISSYDGGNYCLENNVVKDYKTYSCVNPGEPDAYCTDFFRIEVLEQCTGSQTCSQATRTCQQDATCDDGVKNQDETGIDCGGPCSPCSSSMDSIAQCITATGTVLYESLYCPICAAQRRTFGSSFKFINNIICEHEKERCVDEGIRGYPTWEVNGVKYPGASIRYVRSLTGC